jgi:hypothetical protein
MCPLFYLLSLLMILGTYLKIDAFWNSEQVHQVRRWFGDRGASIFYYAIGGAILAFGLFLSTQ